MKISLCINCDNRHQNDKFTGSNLGGCVNDDFIIDGLINKIKFFDGFDLEVIVHLDRHTDVPRETLEKLQELCDTLLIRKHTHEASFNDNSYIRALSLASGDIIIHIDQDTALFRKSKEDVERLLSLLDTHDFVSYPSFWTPLPVHDESFDHVWCSTRFFMCKRENLDLPEITKCLKDYDYWCSTYPVNRRCHWLEHLIGSIAKYRNQSVFYPPLDTENYLIFCWDKYVQGTLQRLNNSTYQEVVDFVNDCGGIHYPVDVTCK